MLPMTLKHCDISSKEAVLLGHIDAEMGRANLLHALAYYSEYNARFDLITLICMVIAATESNFKAEVIITKRF